MTSRVGLDTQTRTETHRIVDDRAPISPAGTDDAPIALVPTVSGRAFDLVNPTADMVSPEDMAEHLAKIPRLLGATPNACVSVAQHSVIVAEALPEYARAYGILHHGHQYVLGDDPVAKMQALNSVEPTAAGAIGKLRRRVDIAIHAAFGLPFPPPGAVPELIREADLQALAAEKHGHMAAEPVLDPAYGEHALPDSLLHGEAPWPWQKAADRFLKTLRQYAPRWPE